MKRNNSPDKWIEYKDESLRIVPQELWDAVHKDSRRSTKKSLNRSGGRRGQYPLSGILVCAECGASMIIHGSKNYSAYVCNSYWNRGNAVCSCGHHLPRVDAEKAVQSNLIELLDSEGIVEGMASDVNSYLKAMTPSRKNEKLRLLKREAKLLKSIENLLNLAERGDSGPHCIDSDTLACQQVGISSLPASHGRLLSKMLPVKESASDSVHRAQCYGSRYSDGELTKC